MRDDLPPLNMNRILDLLVAKVEEHGTLVPRDIAALRSLEPRTRHLAAGEDVVRQGEKPTVSVMMLSGMVAPPHAARRGPPVSFVPNRRRHAGPAVAVPQHDGSFCLCHGEAEIAIFPHRQLQSLLLDRPGVGFALWRMTLVDAAIFRQAITNNSGASTRSPPRPFLLRATAACPRGKACDGRQLRPAADAGGTGTGTRPVSRLGQPGAAEAAARRLVEFRNSRLDVRDWTRLSALAGFDDGYLHCAKQSYISRTPFNRRR